MLVYSLSSRSNVYLCFLAMQEYYTDTRWQVNLQLDSCAEHGSLSPLLVHSRWQVPLGNPSIIVVEGVLRLPTRDLLATVASNGNKTPRPARGIVEITGPADGLCPRLRTIREHKHSTRFVPEPKQSSMPDDCCDLPGKRQLMSTPSVTDTNPGNGPHVARWLQGYP